MKGKVKEVFKEKWTLLCENKNTREVRFLFVTAGIMALTMLFLILALASVPRVPRAAKQLCRAIEKGNLKKIQRLINEESENPLVRFSDSPDEILALYDAETEWVECTVGRNDYNAADDCTTVGILMSVYNKEGLKKIYNIEAIFEKVNTRDKLIVISNMGYGLVGNLQSGRLLKARSIDVEIEVLGKNRFEQKVRIEYNLTASDNDIWSNLRRVHHKSVDQLLQEGDFKYEHKIENGVSCVYITQKGTAEEIYENSLVLNNGGWGMYYAHDGRALKIKNRVGFSTYLNFRPFVFDTNSAENVADYTISFMPGTRVHKEQGEGALVTGRAWVREDLSPSEWITVVGEKWNFYAIGFWSMFSLAIVCIAMLIVKYRSGCVVLYQLVGGSKEKESPQEEIVIDEAELKNLDIEIDVNKKM